MTLFWTAGARRDLPEIVSRIWVDSPSAAKGLRNRIEHTTALLKSQPFLGRPGAIAGTREAIPHPSYRIVYQVVDDTVTILSVVHTARRWPPFEGQGEA